MFVKICGITRKEDARFAMENGVDAIGFIAHPASPRFITAENVAHIANSLPHAFCKVGVFVDTTVGVISDYVAAGINTIQLHGQESAALAEELRKKFDIEVWKVLKTRKIDDINQVLDFPADRILIDTFSRDLAGGSGKVADWNLAAKAVEMLRKPVILAGGLNSMNVADAIAKVEPDGLDVSTGVESSPGQKDHQKIAKLLQVIAKATGA